MGSLYEVKASSLGYAKQGGCKSSSESLLGRSAKHLWSRRHVPAQQASRVVGMTKTACRALSCRIHKNLGSEAVGLGSM